jgi:hypothetical protein
MIEARGTAAEADIPLATEAAHAREVAENPLDYVSRLLGGLDTKWQVVQTVLRISRRSRYYIKEDLKEGRLPKATHISNLTDLLRIKPEDLVNVINSYNRYNNKD